MAGVASLLRCKRFYYLVTCLLWFPLTFSDAAITWTQPSPPHTPFDVFDVYVRTTVQDLLNGSAVQRLSWDFTLSGEALDRIFWTRQKDGTRIGQKTASGSTRIVPTENFLEHYNISSSDPATLIIYDVTEADEGLITCSVETEFGRVWNDIIKVRIVVKPKLINVSTNHSVCEGDNITLFCNATGKPELTVTWTRVLKDGGDSDVLHTGEEWVLTNVNKSTEGTYRCTASVVVGNYSVNHTMDVTVNYLPSINASLLSNHTVEEGDSVTLYCDVFGRPEPTLKWTNVSSGKARCENTWNITNINRADAGEYRCDASNECGNKTRSAFITVHYPPSILVISQNQTANENENVTLNCTADGTPIPNITWTRVSDSSSVFFPLTITGKQDEGFYRCTASNGVGSPVSTDVFITVENYHPINVQLEITLQENVTILSEPFNITCSADAKPVARFLFSRDNTAVFNDTSGAGVYTTNVSQRIPQVTYSCIPYNSFGDGPVKDIIVTVHYVWVWRLLNCFNTAIGPVPGYNTNIISGVPFSSVLTQYLRLNQCSTYKPETVTLSSNATVDSFCDEMWVEFNCSSSNANPPVDGYFLFEDNYQIGFDRNGEWTRNIDKKGNHSYHCEANHTLARQRSIGAISLTVNVSASVVPLSNQTVLESGNVNMYCNSSGSPEPIVVWRKRGSDVARHEKNWTLNNISRTDAGEYRCEATNECNNSSQSFFLIVNYEPDNVVLVSNVSKSKVCLPATVNLTCTADANPHVHSYVLHENQMIIESNSGTWLQRLSTSGHYNYSCEVNNSIGSEQSAIVTITVNVPPSTDSLASVTVIEGSNLSLTCNSSGIPSPSVKWIRVSSGEEENGKTWIVTNISRDNKGEYKCEATNECDTSTTITVVTVHYSPHITEPSDITIESLPNKTVKIPCNATGNPTPNVSWTNLTSGEKTASDGVLLFNPITESDSGSVYTCTADNGVEPADSVNISLIVGVNNTNLTIRILNETCVEELKDIKSDAAKELSSRIKLGLRSVEMLKGTVNKIQVNEFSCGCVVAEVALTFNRIVNIQSVISALKAAARNGSLGDLTVDPDSIVQTPSATTAATTPTQRTTLTSTENSKLLTWHFIVIGVGALIVLILVVVIVACWFNKRRKCRKDTRVHDNEDAAADQQPLQELRRSGTEENSYSRVNHGYSESGPTPNSEKPQGAASAADVPAYAVVDKSTKKSERRDAPPEYATVDKSQKNGKKTKQEENAPDSQNATYAVVNKSTKKKKKSEESEDMCAQDGRSKKTKRPNLGDVLYADLGEFHARGDMPQVATSPELLPPIKRPPAYEKTEYADITQFLKGDATLPQSVDTSHAAEADLEQSHPPMDETQASGAATGASSVSKL